MWTDSGWGSGSFYILGAAGWCAFDFYRTAFSSFSIYIFIYKGKPSRSKVGFYWAAVLSEVGPKVGRARSGRSSVVLCCFMVM